MKDKAYKRLLKLDSAQEKSLLVEYLVAVGCLLSVSFIGTGFLVFLVTRAFSFSFLSAFLVAYVFLSYFLLSGLLKTEILNDFLIRMIQLVKNAKTQKVDIFTPSRYKTLKITSILFSAKTQNEIFLPAMSDWDEEIFEALKENKDANLFMINVRNTYGFIMAMWQKSPLGDLLEYVRKIAS